MRTLLRGLAAGFGLAVRAFTLLTAVVAAIVAVALADKFAWSILVAVVALGLTALLAGILQCLSALAHAPLPAVPPGNPAVRRGLRALAVAQVALSVVLAGLAAAKAYPVIRVYPWREPDEALFRFWVLGGAVGYACLGGVLWCAVRVAYPDGRTAGK